MRSYRRPSTRRYVRTVPRRTTARRQAFGNFASAMQQRDSTNVVISTEEDVTIFVPQGCSEATLVRNCNAILTSTPYFENYMGMYDQFKVNAVRVSAEMTYIGNDLLNQTRFPSICTSWDRNGIRITTVQAGGNAAYMLPNYATVASYSSANEKTIYYGSRWGVVRQLDAASMMEKSMYMPTANTRDVLTHGNMYAAWNPQFLIALKTTADVQVIQSCKISLHWQFDVTLRGLRKVNTQNLNKFIPYAGFIGYAKDNSALAITGNNGQNIPVTPAGPQGNPPSINPEYDPAIPDNGLIIPNTGLPAQNPGL